MKYFQEAFNAGQLAYVKSESAKLEIAGIVSEFADGVKEASHGKIGIERKPTKSSFIEAFDIGSHSNRYELCTIHISDHGYPVTINLHGNDTRCHVRADLETALADVLKDMTNAGLLRTLMVGTQKNPTKCGE